MLAFILAEESNLKLAFRKLLCNERGQGLMEYALIIFFVALALLVTIGAIGTNLNGIFALINSVWS